MGNVSMQERTVYIPMTIGKILGHTGYSTVKLTYPDVDFLVQSDACFYIEKLGGTVGHCALLRREILLRERERKR